MMRTLTLLLGLLISISILSAQSVEIEPTIEPEFFSASEEITITYDVTGTILHDWTEAWIWAWVPNSSSATIPSNINPASSNSSLSDLARFTKSVDNGKQLFTIKLTPTDFVGLPANEIKTLGMLIKGNDWSDGQSIDYVTEVGDEFRILFDEPTGEFAFYDVGETISIRLRASQVADLQLFEDNIPLATAFQNTELSINYQANSDGNIHEIMAIGTVSPDVADTLFFRYTVPPTPPMLPIPAGLRDGINYLSDDTKATLILHAPGKKNVYVLGDFNNWSLDNDYLMNQDGDRFWLPLENLSPGVEYRFQYLVDGVIRIADPYSEKISSPFDDPQIINENRYPGLPEYPTGLTTEGIGFLQTDRPTFDWSGVDYQRPAKEDLVIYELLIRDFTDERDFQATIDRLDYLQELGINAIELMPIMEFEGNISWGYNPAFMFSVDKFYGTENQLKTLVKEAHRRGMAVILDIVLNHAFGRCPLVRLYNDDLYGPPTPDNPWLNRVAKHDFNVGYDFNHESSSTKEYVDRVNEYWIEEYQIDGFRFDLSKGFTQKSTLGNTGAWGNYDASRVALLKRMADKIWEKDADSYVILEHFADNIEEQELAEYGMMLWGNMNRAYITTAKGNPNGLFGAFHKDRGIADPHVIAYMESHDEERVMWEIKEGDRYTTEEALERIKLNAAFFFLVPGPKMIWQFEELGYEEELNNDRLGIKPTRWEYLNDPERKKLFDVFASLIKLRTETDYIDSDYFSWSTNSLFKWLHIDHPEVKIAAFGNFRNDMELKEIVPFPAAGTWYDFYSGETLEVDDPENFSMTLQAGELRVYTSAPIDNYIEGNPLPERMPDEILVGDPEVLQLFPSPVEDLTTVQYPEGMERLWIYDATGKVMKVIEVEEGVQQALVDLTKLPAGVYILSGESNEAVQSVKFIKY